MPSRPSLPPRRHRRRDGPRSPASKERPPTTSAVPTRRSPQTSTTGPRPCPTSATPSGATSSSPRSSGPRPQENAWRRPRLPLLRDRRARSTGLALAARGYLEAPGVEGVRAGAVVRIGAAAGCEGAALASLHRGRTALHAPGHLHGAVAAFVAA